MYMNFFFLLKFKQFTLVILCKTEIHITIENSHPCLSFSTSKSESLKL